MDVPRRRGRPREGQRVTVRLAPQAIAYLDRRAAQAGSTRAQAIRNLVADEMAGTGVDGVDRAQIQRMLRLTPAERLAHMTETANRLQRFKGAAVRR